MPAPLVFLIGGAEPNAYEALLREELVAWGYSVTFAQAATAPAADAGSAFGGGVVGESVSNSIHADWGLVALPWMVCSGGAFVVMKVAGALGSSSSTQTSGYVHSSTDSLTVNVVGAVGTQFVHYTAPGLARYSGNSTVGPNLTVLLGHTNSNATLCRFGVYRNGALHDGTTGLPPRAIMGLVAVDLWTAGAEELVRRMAVELYGPGGTLPLSGGTIAQGAVAYNSVSLTSSAPASGGTGPYTYAWQRKTGTGSYGTLSGQTGAALTDATAAASTTYTYRRRVTDSAGSPATAYSNEVTVTTGAAPNIPPTVEILDASVTGRTVTLVVAESDSDGSLAGAVTAWGDGTSDGQLTHTYLDGGRYTITRTVSDNQGAQAEAQVTVTTYSTYVYTARATVAGQQGPHSAPRTIQRPDAT
jgi:hypothetical protein